MSTVPQTDSTQQEAPLELSQLADAVAKLPPQHRGELESLVSQVMDGARRRRRILSLVQDALSQLRLDMKYLMFDLEATRRERDEYKAQLEQSAASQDEEDESGDEDGDDFFA
jgi:uncharacterized coiled-coil DUF342 family protein